MFLAAQFALLLSHSVSNDVIDVQLAERYFTEAKAAATADQGKLWGRSLIGPILFVDRATRTAVTNMPPGSGDFKKVGNVYTGTIPPDMVVANTSVPWGDKRWTMVMWPLPSSKPDRVSLLMHESWHRIQNELNLPSEMVSNQHLDSFAGRLWIQLEVRALAKALVTSGRVQNGHLADALAMRQYRQQLAPGAKKEEDRMEVHEGLAEYTGFALSGLRRKEAMMKLSQRLSSFGSLDSFPASFAYYTGPSYGLFLDAASPNWRKALSTQSSLVDELRKARGLRVSADQAVSRARKYGYDSLLKTETVREETRLAKENRYLDLLVRGPILKISFVSMNFSYDPNTVFPLGKHGTVYPVSTITDAWGKLTVTDGALIDSNFQGVTVSAKGVREGTTAGEGWKLELAEGWKLVPGDRPGDFVLSKKLPS